MLTTATATRVARQAHHMSEQQLVMSFKEYYKQVLINNSKDSYQATRAEELVTIIGKVLITNNYSKSDLRHIMKEVK